MLRTSSTVISQHYFVKSERNSNFVAVLRIYSHLFEPEKKLPPFSVETLNKSISLSVASFNWKNMIASL
jgi:hypothetical protein